MSFFARYIFLPGYKYKIRFESNQSLLIFVVPCTSPSLPLSFLLGINCQLGMLKGDRSNELWHSKWTRRKFLLCSCTATYCWLDIDSLQNWNPSAPNLESCATISANPKTSTYLDKLGQNYCTTTFQITRNFITYVFLILSVVL